MLIDGYIVQNKKLIQADPSIADAAPLEDDLITALRNSKAHHREAIIDKINDSAEAFRSSPSDYNAALTNARVALEALAVDVAADVVHEQQATATYNPAKWGEVIGFLRNSGEITVEEEKGLTGVFGFLSPGAHRPIGIPENQMARLGRFLCPQHVLVPVAEPARTPQQLMLRHSVPCPAVRVRRVKKPPFEPSQV